MREVKFRLVRHVEGDETPLPSGEVASAALPSEGQLISVGGHLWRVETVVHHVHEVGIGIPSDPSVRVTRIGP